MGGSAWQLQDTAVRGLQGAWENQDMGIGLETVVVRGDSRFGGPGAQGDECLELGI